MTIKKLQAELGIDTSDFTGGILKAIGALGQIGRAIDDFAIASDAAAYAIGAVGAAVLAAAFVVGNAVVAVSALAKELAEFAAASIKAAAEYETSMTRVAALTGAQKPLVDEWKVSLLGLAGELGKTPQELAEGLYFLASSGIVGAEALDVLEVAAMGSASGMGRTKDVAQALVAIINSYGAENLSASRAMDILTATIAQGGAEADSLAGALGRVSGIAAAVGVSFEEVGAFVGIFTRSIPSADEAVTSLRQTILNLTAPNNQAKESLAALGLTSDQLRASIKDRGLLATLQDLMKITDGNIDKLDLLIPNVRALAGVMVATANGGDAYRGVLDAIVNSQGDLSRAFDLTKQSMDFQWKQVTSEFEAMKVAVGLGLGPALQALGGSIAPAARDAMRALGLLILENRTAIAGLAAQAIPLLTHAFAALLQILGAMIGQGLPLLIELFEDFRIKAMLAVDTMKALALAAAGQTTAAAVAATQAYTSYTKAIEDSAKKQLAMREQTSLAAQALSNAGVKAILAGEQIKKQAEAAAKGAGAVKSLGAEYEKLYQGILGGGGGALTKGPEIFSKDELEKRRKEAFDMRVALLQDAQATAEEAQRTVNSMLDRSLGDSLKSAMAGLEPSKGDMIKPFQERLALRRQEILDTRLQQKEDLRINEILFQQGTISKQEFEARKTQIQGVTAETRTWSSALQDIANQVRSMGGVFGQVGGTILGGVASIGAQLEGLAKNGVKGVGDIFKGGFSKVLQNASGVFAMAGAALGIGKALHGLFTSSPAEKAAKEAGQMLGFKVSKELGETIAKTAKDLKIDFKSATLLNLDKVMAESGKGVTAFAGEIKQLIAGLQSGALPAAQAVEQISKAFTKVREEAQKGSLAAQKLMLDMIRSGAQTPEIAAALKESLGRAASGVTAMIKGGFSNQGDVQDQARIFMATFFGLVATEGPLAAVKAMQPAYDAMVERMKALKMPDDALDAILGPAKGLMQLAGDEATSGMLEGIQGLQDALGGLADSGFLTGDAFTAIQSQAMAAFTSLTESGVAESTALTAIAPLLGQIQQTAQMYGLTLDENTQKLVAQAEAAGIAFPQEPMQQMVSLLGQIVTLLGGELPAAATTAGTTMTSAIAGAATQSSGAFAGAASSITTSMGGIKAPVEATFTEMADFAFDRAEFVSISWNGQMAEIGLFIGDMVPMVEEAFIDLESAATEPLGNVASAVGRIVGGLHAIPGAAGAAGSALAGLPGGSAPMTESEGISAKTGFGPKKLDQDTFFLAHAGEQVLIVPANMSGDFGFVSAAKGFGGDDIQVGGWKGGGGVPAPPVGPTDDGSLGAVGSASADDEEQASGGVVKKLGKQLQSQSAAISRLMSAIKDVADREPAQQFVSSPQVQVAVDPLGLQRNNDDFMANLQDTVAKAIVQGEGAIFRAVESRYGRK